MVHTGVLPSAARARPAQPGAPDVQLAALLRVGRGGAGQSGGGSGGGEVDLLDYAVRCAPGSRSHICHIAGKVPEVCAALLDWTILTWWCCQISRCDPSSVDEILQLTEF